MEILRLDMPGWGVEVRFQSYFVPIVEPLRPGTVIPGSVRPSGPASRTRIWELGRPWLILLAMARPAVPPPIMIWVALVTCPGEGMWNYLQNHKWQKNWLVGEHWLVPKEGEILRGRERVKAHTARPR